MMTTAGGPKGKGMENRLEKPDAPIISSEAKKSYLRVKKARALAQMDLITQVGKPIADNDQNETDYFAATSQPNPHAKSEEDPSRQYNTDSE